eukprot:CAMPEP_0198455788 /NCGR_PEP_ID=MMETSP1453-20131121/21280_1 /TAXON_ID=1461543 ORGANISM="Unidentified sp., Strain RCC701" /NCGR_SAMPLE_ID=MMETSP1453 /ASSEMBLY_ACC=CAM_ASM_001118 /LENGTH=110 /DNA_ID=CAMNT_0044180217 /DNA_START=18 /DNA_END=350 /DNA_ORIENTATION=+
MKRLVTSTMARSFRLGRSLFGTTPGGSSRNSSVANTPVQTPRYSNLNPSGSSASMVFNGTHHSQQAGELPSSYESNVNLYTNDNSISEENASLTSHIRNESNGEMEEPFE